MPPEVDHVMRQPTLAVTAVLAASLAGCGAQSTTTTATTTTTTTSTATTGSATRGASAATSDPSAEPSAAGHATTSAASGVAHDEHAWGYEGATGPGAWGSLDAEYAVCSTGRAQSPVDLTGEQGRDLPDLEVAYRRTPLTVWNPGHTQQVVVQPGSTLTVGGVRHTLAQLHFHTPSEHLVDGAPAAGELHLVHQDDAGRPAVLGVLLREGSADHPAYAALWRHLQEQAGDPVAVPGESIDPTTLLPKDLGYRQYTGSLTTPPCTEGVTWRVLTEPVTLSRAQLDRLEEVMGHNARPAQPLNGRALARDTTT